MAIRVAKLQITGMDAETKKRWRSMSDDCQCMTNTIWQEWLLWHVRNGSREKITDYLAGMKQWHETEKAERGDKPKCDVVAVSSVCGRAIYARLDADFPHIHNRVRSLLQNSIVGLIKKRKAANGNLPGWMAILLCRESLPSTTKGQPIPFDKRSCPPDGPIELPNERGENAKLTVRLARVVVAGKKSSPSLEETVALWTKGRKAEKELAKVKRIVSGEWPFKGSEIFRDSRDGRWYAHICYEIPQQEAAEMDTGKVAFLHPHATGPWRLRYRSRYRFPGGRGQAVHSVRRRIILQRKSRSNNYRNAASSTKGHGRKRAWGGNWKLTGVWSRFVKSFNHGATREVIDYCKQNGIGRLVYFQPAEKCSRQKFLASAGKVPGVTDGTGWDWFQVKTQLEYKCQEAGIELVVRKFGERKPRKSRAA